MQFIHWEVSILKTPSLGHSLLEIHGQNTLKGLLITIQLDPRQSVFSEALLGLQEKTEVSRGDKQKQ